MRGAQVAEQGRPDREAVVVDLDGCRCSRLMFQVRLASLVKARDREILAEEVGVQDPVVRGGRNDVVEPGIGVLLEPPDRRRRFELPAIVVAIAEQADAELVVLEQEARGNRTGMAGCRRAASRSRSGRTVRRSLSMKSSCTPSEIIEAAGRL